MQQAYRPFPQQQPPQRSPHASTSRRGIGPMVGPHPTASLTAAQQQAQQQSQHQASERAKLRSRKPTDKAIPDGVEDYIIGDGVQRYKELRELERRLDATMTRKRLDLQESVNRNVKRARTLRIWISNTVEDQPWQADALDVDAFDFNTNMDSAYRVKIEGKLLDEEEDYSDSEDDSEDESQAMDEDNKQPKKKRPEPKQYKFSHFFRSMTVDYDKSRSAGQDHTVEWKKPQGGTNTSNPLPAADFDQLEFKRAGDENTNITINLYREEHPEKYQLKGPIAEILDVSSATRAEVVMGIWDYIRLNDLQDEDEKRSFECDDKLRQLFNGQDKGYIPYIPEAIAPFMDPLPPIKLPYTIRVDREFHASPTPTVYDITVHIDDPIRDTLNAYLTNPLYASNLREIAQLNDNLSLLVQKIAMSKGKHAFFEQLSKHPVEFIGKWLSSQRRDLEVIAGEATRGGGEDASGDEWRKGGNAGIWGSDNVRESVSLMVNTKAR